MQEMVAQISGPIDLLLGRKTYDIFAAYWPKTAPDNPIGTVFNKATKYVVSKTMSNPSWGPASVISQDVAGQIRALKASAGPDLQVHGSGNLVQTLLKNDLVDELWLKIFPLTLGSGKKLFAGGTIPAAFTLERSITSPAGVIFANYARDGEVRTGTIG
jgi:dihydrofolate reductase